MTPIGFDGESGLLLALPNQHWGEGVNVGGCLAAHICAGVQGSLALEGYTEIQVKMGYRDRRVWSSSREHCSYRRGDCFKISGGPKRNYFSGRISC